MKPIRNKLVFKTMLKSFWPNFFISLIFNLNAILDIFAVGCIFKKDTFSFYPGLPIGRYALAGLFVSLLITMLMTAILSIFVNGTVNKFKIALGRGETNESKTVFTKGLLTIICIGLLLSVLVFAFGDLLVKWLWDVNNSSHDSSLVIAYASMYLKYGCLTFTISAVAHLYIKILEIYGHRNVTFISLISNLIVHLVLIIVLFNFVDDSNFPVLSFWNNDIPNTGYVSKVELLALASLGGSIVDVIICVVFKSIYKIPVSLKLSKLSWKSFASTIKSGIYDSLRQIIKAISLFVIVQIIFRSPNSESPYYLIGTFAVFYSLFELAQVAAEAISNTTKPIIDFFYQTKDTSGIKQMWKSSALGGMVFSLIWATILVLVSPVLIGMFSDSLIFESTTHSEINHFQLLSVIILFTSVFTSYLHVLSFFYKTVGNKLMNVLQYAIPMLIFFPLFALLGASILKNNDDLLLLSFGLALSVVAYFIIQYVLFAIKFKTPKFGLANYLSLKESEGQEAILDVSIHNKSDDISLLAKQVQEFLSSQEMSQRTSYMVALSMDELANDFINKGESLGKENSELSFMDIKMISEKEKIKIIIRNVAKQYNPLDFDITKNDFSKVGVKMIQRAADYISYQYLYKMNVVSIEVKK